MGGFCCIVLALTFGAVSGTMKLPHKHHIRQGASLCTILSHCRQSVKQTSCMIETPKDEKDRGCSTRQKVSCWQLLMILPVILLALHVCEHVPIVWHIRWMKRESCICNQLHSAGFDCVQYANGVGA